MTHRGVLQAPSQAQETPQSTLSPPLLLHLLALVLLSLTRLLLALPLPRRLDLLQPTEDAPPRLLRTDRGDRHGAAAQAAASGTDFGDGHAAAAKAARG
jgi:hypothetical protein